MHLHVGVQFQKFANSCRLMSREVVSDNVNLPFDRLMSHNCLQKRDKRLAGMPGSWPAKHRTSLRLQGCVEREGSVSVVFKAVAFSAPWRHRQNWVQSIKGLNGALFVYAENGRIGR